MDRTFNTRLLYLAALFALAAIGVVLRLWHMQVTEHAEYERRTEATRARTELLFPARARILDAKGRVLADSESVWDLALDAYELTHPRHVLARAKASPEVYPPLAEVEQFHREVVLPALEADVPAPQRARRFLSLWRLRDHPIARHDRSLVIEQLARMTGCRPDLLGMRLDVVDGEVDAIVSQVGDPARASRQQILRAFNASMSASRDPEYWERIRRFPKSIALEPVLRRRIELHREHLAQVERVVAALRRSSAPTEQLRAELASVQERVRLLGVESGGAGDAGADQASAMDAEGELDGVGDPEVSLKREELVVLRRFETLLERCLVAQDPIAALLAEAAVLDGAAGEIADLETRLGRLQERVLRPNLEAWESRWPGVLDRLAEIARQNGAAESKTFENPIIIAQRVDRHVVEAIKANGMVLSGLRCEPRSVRRYPLGATTQGLVGHTRLPDSDALAARLADAEEWEELAELRAKWFRDDGGAMAQNFAGTIARQAIGVSGIEGYHEARLFGRPGARAVYMDARGNERSVEGEWNPTAASDLTLTLDAELMEFAANAVRQWEPKLRAKAIDKFGDTWAEVGEWRWALRGSLIVLDVETGAVLCMLDINDDVTGRAARLPAGKQDYGPATAASLPPSWQWLDPASALPRSAGGLYEPGSTFKILTSIAMLEDGIIDASSRFDDVRNTYRIGTEMIRTSHPAGADIDIVRAISRSANGYYWFYSTKLGDGRAKVGLEECLIPWAKRFGFGERPGLDTAGLQAAGVLPRMRIDDPPELARNVIGQGRLLSTPLQVARFMAAVAARGKLTRPHLSAETDPLAVELPVSESTWDLVHRGMTECVHRRDGTAYRSATMRAVQGAGKTGTAQTGRFYSRDAWQRRQNGERVAPDLLKPDHAWFAGFAPFDKPKVAFVMLAEFSGLPGSDVADVVGEVVQRALQTPAATPGPQLRR